MKIANEELPPGRVRTSALGHGMEPWLGSLLLWEVRGLYNREVQMLPWEGRPWPFGITSVIAGASKCSEIKGGKLGAAEKASADTLWTEISDLGW